MERKSMIKLSVVIPTCNRSESLKDTLNSLEGQILDKNLFEVIICDNNSTDNTREIARAFKNKFPNFKYAKSFVSGLHVGRNLGLQLAQGEIISYLDDDVIVDPSWGEAIIKRFDEDKGIVMVGGPCRPLWEGEQPDWLSEFIIEGEDEWILGELSLIDLGNKPKIITASDVYGCNFSIRKKILFDLGGFHPDGMPRELLKYRGDGESGLAEIIDNKKMKVFYEPRAVIMHRIPQERMTKKYFLEIARRGAYGGAYSKYRALQSHGLPGILKEIILRIEYFFVSFFRKIFLKNGYRKKEDYWFMAHWCGLFHFLRILLSPELKKWVTQDSYFKEDWCPYAKKSENNL